MRKTRFLRDPFKIATAAWFIVFSLILGRGNGIFSIGDIILGLRILREGHWGFLDGKSNNRYSR